MPCSESAVITSGMMHSFLTLMSRSRLALTPRCTSKARMAQT